MKTIATQFGVSATADFEESTWTFEMPEKYSALAGTFAIVDKQIYDEMLICLKQLYTENIMTAEMAERCKAVVEKSNKVK